MLENDGSFLLADISERFAVMRKLESTTYRCDDYLSPSFQAQHLMDESSNKLCNIRFENIRGESECNGINNCLNEAWREKICEWSYQVVDHFDLSRETASVSISFLDRYLCTRPNVNKKLFQLAAIAALHLASKLNELKHMVVQMSSLTELSRGFFVIEHIRSMEQKILNALDWHVHPPTTLAFARQLLLLLDNYTSFNVPLQVTRAITETAQFLSELSVCDYFFVSKRTSDIATACILNAIESISEINLPNSARVEFIDSVRLVAGVDCNSIGVQECRARLHEIYTQGGYYQPTVNHEVSPIRKRHKNNSPVCASDYERHR